MSGTKLSDYAIGNSNLDNIMLSLDGTFLGDHTLTITEFDTTTVPAIAAGSRIEINGGLYKFDSEEAISTTDPVTTAAVADGVVYIITQVAGSSVTAAFTATAPTWSDSKQGYYGTGGQANNRYAEYKMTKATTSYSDKKQYPIPDNPNILIGGSGSIEGVMSKVEASSSTNQALPTTNTVIQFEEIVFDVLSEYDNITNYDFTATYDGYYLAGYTLVISNVAATGVIRLGIYVNGTVAYTTYSDHATSIGENFSHSGTWLLNLSAGDTVDVRVNSLGAGETGIVQMSTESPSFIVARMV